MPYFKPKFASVAASTVGDNEIVAAVSGKQIRVLGYAIVASVAVTAQWKSGSTTTLSGAMSLAANGTVVVAGDGDTPVLETAEGEALNLAITGTTPTVDGHVWYQEVG